MKPIESRELTHGRDVSRREFLELSAGTAALPDIEKMR
jgi:hypothetical protein